jgi:hypothetical protein
MMLRWRHLGGMVAAILAAGITGGTAFALAGEGLPFPDLVLAGLLAAFVHVGLFAMPLFARSRSAWVSGRPCRGC